jgi:pimeloyl-ACP methyl ester carboxylesterase
VNLYGHDLLVSGRRLHYLDSQAGAPTLVLCHGLGGSSQHWLQVMPLLAEHARVLALDLPGFGDSEDLRGPVSYDRLVDLLAEVAALLELGPVVLIGHSFSGPLALRFAARHPSLALGLVLVGGAVFQFTALLGLRRVRAYIRARPRESGAILAEVLGAGLALPVGVRRAIAGSQLLRGLTLWPYVLDPAVLSVASARILLDGAGAPGVLPTVRAIAGSDPLQGAESVHCPILSLAGDSDLIVPLGDTSQLQQAVPHVRTCVFERCGHMPMLEQPLPFAERLLTFVSELSVPEPATPTGATP